MTTVEVDGRGGGGRSNRRLPGDSLGTVASWDEVRRLATALPEVTEREAHDGRAWRVRRKDFAWERPLRAADRAALGEAAPSGPVLGLHLGDLGAKEALLAEEPDVVLTTPHFDGYPVVLVRLDLVELRELEELLLDAWLASAPKRLAAAHVDALRPGRP